MEQNPLPVPQTLTSDMQEQTPSLHLRVAVPGVSGPLPWVFEKRLCPLGWAEGAGGKEPGGQASGLASASLWFSPCHTRCWPTPQAGWRAGKLAPS